MPGGFKTAAFFVKPLLMGVTRREWSGGENLPQDQGFIAVSNHATYADPFTLAHFLYDHGFAPHFLAKASLFDIPLAGRGLKGLDQVPVHRGSAKAKDAVDAAVKLLQRGDSIAVFPEGTLTRDPDLWPMKGRTGAARMALDHNVPVIPIAQWGAHQLLAPYGKKPSLIPPKLVKMKAGPPIDLDDFRTGDVGIEALRGATDRIMATLTTMVGELRGETPPAEPYDSRNDKKEGK
ncbi:1-acyl-sn-glycerol-3-phosphate acyltransferase [Demequina sp. B12]|uniref:lysophospholipid acyltransferase family protein n=1 Tax=Demequina sp. B12 TaxID=2992757 RepID=UPI00237A95EF|nr:lysophospholipid acyltransferase family protein [Demequina sp. B12]MDE0572765.1 1-acyl-sn-glycerol-3-phosphate acyltransferase [Demequina sp. B12]